MVREPARHASARGHHVNINASVIVSGKSDHGAVWRKDWITLGSVAAGEQARLTAFTRNQPQVTRVGECNVRRGKRGLLHQQWPARMGGASEHAKQSQGQNRKVEFTHRPPEE